MSNNSFSVHEPSVTQSDEISLFDLLQVIVENLRLLLLGPVIAGAVALGITFLIPPTFTASTTFLAPAQQQSVAATMLQTLGPLAGVAGGSLGNPADRYVAFVESRSVRDAVVERLDLMKRYDAKSRAGARQILASAAKVSATKNGLITIEIDDRDPKLAADIANAHIEELTAFLGRMNVTEAQARRAFFEQQLKKTKDGLVAAEIALKSTGINESAIKSSPAAAVGGVAALMAHIAAKEVELAAMRGSFTESAPDLKRIQAELGALRSQLSRVDKESNAGTAGSDYVARYRNFKYQETLFELVAKQYEMARIDESKEGTVIQVVDPAMPPEHKSKPKKAQIATIIAVAAGLGLLLFVFVRHGLRNASRNPEAAHKMALVRESFRRAIRKG